MLKIAHHGRASDLSFGSAVWRFEPHAPAT